MCVGAGRVEVAPSPKSQLQLVGEPVEASLKATVSGAAPDNGVPLKSAAGGGGSVLGPSVRTSCGRGFELSLDA